MNKSGCRAEGLRRRAALPEAYRREAERQIRESLLASEWYARAERLLVYASYREEVSTWQLMEAALADGKQVYCPKTILTASERRLDFYRITSPDELKPGFSGIREPEAREELRYRWPCADPEEPEAKAHGKLPSGQADREPQDLVILPGCAFDRLLHRLGYGGGFYDRFLAGKEELVRLALGFSCQVLSDTLPQEETDICPDVLITEREILRRSRDGDVYKGNTER